MPIRTAGALPITEIVNEFGGSTPHGLSEYYGDGSFINNVYFPTTPKIPNRGSAINIGAFYGKSKRRVVSVEINTNIDYVDIFSLFKPLLVNEPLPVDAFLIIKSGVLIGTTDGTLNVGTPDNLARMFLAAASSSRANSFRSDDTLTIENYGNIIGIAGAGGVGGRGTSTNITGNPTNGFVGLPAMQLSFPVRIDNYGTIASGGKGGRGGNGSFSVVDTITSYYDCGPIIRDCLAYAFQAVPGAGGCTQNFGEGSGCWDDATISRERCFSKWLNDRYKACGCGSCCKKKKYRCTQRRTRPNTPARCDEDGCGDTSGKYFCNCTLNCTGGYGNVASPSVRCPTTSKVDNPITGGDGGFGRAHIPASLGLNSTPSVLAECRGSDGGDLGSNTAIVSNQTIRVNGNSPIGGISATFISPNTR